MFPRAEREAFIAFVSLTCMLLLASTLLPLCYLCWYLGAFSTYSVSHPVEYLESQRSGSHMVTYLCTEIIITRYVVLLQCFKMLDLVSGKFHAKGASSRRFRWYVTLCAVALGNDVIAQIFYHMRTHACQQGNESYNTLEPLCESTINLPLIAIVIHTVGMVVLVATLASAIVWVKIRTPPPVEMDAAAEQDSEEVQVISDKTD